MACRGAFAILFLLAGCAGGKLVRVRASDPTPPAAALEVLGPGELLRLHAGGQDGQVELAGSDSLVITGTAVDEGGVRDMALMGHVRVTCGDPATGATWTRTTAFVRRHVPGSPRVERAPGRRDSRYVLRPDELAKACRGGELRTAVGLARFQAANYGGGSARTPLLEFRLAMSEVAAQAIGLPVSAEATLAGTAGTPRAGTGHAPGSGIGGSGESRPRMCPRPAGSARQAPSADTAGGARPVGAGALHPECLDTPVPSLSPPSGTRPGRAQGTVKPPSRAPGAYPLRGRRAQIPQIRHPVAPGI